MALLTVDEIILGIDFSLLKEQKKFLLGFIENTDNILVLEYMEGILVLIDEIQDYAVDVLGYNENDIFDLETE
jgi:hypothetical protein